MHDGTGQILAETDLLIEKGKIVQIGKHLDAPGAQVIEAAGKCVMPGWIDPLSGWGTAAGRGQARDNDETSDPVTPQLDVVDAFDPESMLYQQLWGYGITAAGVAASNNNILGGRAAVFKAYGKTTEAMCVKPGCDEGLGRRKGQADLWSAQQRSDDKNGDLCRALRELIAKCRSEKEEDQKDPKVRAFKPVLQGKCR